MLRTITNRPDLKHDALYVCNLTSRWLLSIVCMG